MTARAGFATVWLLIAGVACDDAPAPGPRALRAVIQWNDLPASPADIGYRVDVEVDRGSQCTRAPADRQVMVNDRAAQPLGTLGDCASSDTFTVGGFVADAPITIRVLDGARPIGEATFEGAFPGFQSRLVTPADGRVPAGGDVVVTVPPGYEAESLYPAAQFYWRDVPPGLPAFYTESLWADVSLDGASVTVRAPDVPGLQGRAALVYLGFDGEFVEIEACTGFAPCSLVVPHVVGPIELEVLAPPGAP